MKTTYHFKKGITMEILFENIMLVDDPTYKGGCSFDGETLADFIREDD